jgi:hypothetical protein
VDGVVLDVLLMRAARFAALASTFLAACAWSVPADPGANAKARARAVPSVDARSPRPTDVAEFEVDVAARASYESRCGRCHAPFSPRHAAAEEWPAFVRKYGPRAGLFGAERDRVLAWLQANSR